MEQSLEQLKHRIAQFSIDRDWAQFHDPKNLAISLQLEASEVLELFQWTNDNQIQKTQPLCTRSAQVAHGLKSVIVIRG